MVAVSVLLAGCGDGGGRGDAHRNESPRPPVKVTSADLRFMEAEIGKQYTEQADLTDDTSEYTARNCRVTGRGRATCTINVYTIEGERINSYPKLVLFDPADPGRFRMPGEAVESPRGSP
jgi:hypothetical protein